MNCLDIVAKYLKDNGYDGLFNDECGCELSDLRPCCDDITHCTPGYKVAPPPDVRCEYDFYICASKDARPWGAE
jgi:hypothetical protein